MPVNRNLVLIGGKSAAGKTVSLRNLRNSEGVIYLCCEAGKELPFARNDSGEMVKFKQKVITHPSQIPAVLTAAEDKPKIHTVIIDSLTYLMDMYESQLVINATNTMKAWGDYAQFFKNMMQVQVAGSRLNVIFLAHTSDIYNEGDLVTETMVKVKGSLMQNGIESYFNNVISSKKVPLTDLVGQESKMLNITEEDEINGFKYVFQTRLTKKTVNERIRGPIAMWSNKEIFIDNDLQMVLDNLHTYYSE